MGPKVYLRIWVKVCKVADYRAYSTTCGREHCSAHSAPILTPSQVALSRLIKIVVDIQASSRAKKEWTSSMFLLLGGEQY